MTDPNYYPDALVRHNGGRVVDTSQHEPPQAPPIRIQRFEVAATSAEPATRSAFERWGTIACLVILILILAGFLAGRINP